MFEASQLRAGSATGAVFCLVRLVIAVIRNPGEVVVSIKGRGIYVRHGPAHFDLGA
jgi:hypothetical protein